MSEDILNEATAENQTATASSESQNQDASVQGASLNEFVSTENSEEKELVNPMTGETISPKKPKAGTFSGASNKTFQQETFINPMTGEEEQTTLGSQVIIKKDRGLAYYVGFALLVVLSIAIFFMPGIAITFAASRLVDLNTSAAWVFSAILSFVVWLLFKFKIKGFSKSFNWYLVLCVLCIVAMLIIQIAGNYNIFSEVVALLIGAKA